MRAPLSWLCDFAPFGDDAVALAETLDDLGLVVEGIEQIGEGLADVVVARVEEIAAIAGADKIRRVVVDAGDGPVEVVCGAWNFAQGDLVPLAVVGAVLPGGFEIARRKMKGVTSHGMLCSGRELNLSDDHEGIMVLGEGNAIGTPLADALGIEPDAVFDIAVEANRPDAWCMAGVARDLAAKLRLPFASADPPAPRLTATAVADQASLEVIDDDMCPRFTARVLTGVHIEPSPRLVARRLTLAGMRPINNVVDASNYVMLELGQPTHPYDLDRVPGHMLRVRAAHRGETVTTLDGVERRLADRSVGAGDDGRDCVICDGNDVPIGVAGVMGGVTGEISEATTTVLLEAAYFLPMAIARTSKRLGLRSEASARFERGCDPEGIDRAALRLCQLVGAADGEGRVAVSGGVLETRGPVPTPTRITVRTARVNAVLGTDLDDARIASYLTPIGFGCEASAAGILDVTIPTFRPDSSREIDVIEEVARHHGYASVPRRRPRSPQVGRLTPYQRERRLVRDVMAGLGAHEAWTTSMVSPEDHRKAGMGEAIVVANPISPEDSVLRLGLLPGMVRAISFNADRREGEVRLFEIGHVFPPPDKARVARALERSGETVVDEREMLGLALSYPGDDATTAASAWITLADVLGIRGVSMVALDEASASGSGAPPGVHPSRCARLVINGDPSVSLGVVGEIDPDVLDAFGIDSARQRVGWLEIDLGVLLEVAPRRSALVEPVSRFPSSDVDLAFVVDDGVAAADVRRALHDAGGPDLESVALFDVFRGTGTAVGTRSLAFRLRFCALDRTLTDDEVGARRAGCVEAAERITGVRLPPEAERLRQSA